MEIYPASASTMQLEQFLNTAESNSMTLLLENFNFATSQLGVRLLAVPNAAKEDLTKMTVVSADEILKFKSYGDLFMRNDKSTASVIRNKILERIEEEKSPAYITSDFKEYGNPSQVNRCIRALIKDKKLIRVGVGIYTPAKISSRTGNETPIFDVLDIAVSALRKLGIEAEYGEAYRNLFSGKSTQVPMIPIVNVKNSKTSRKIKLGRGEVVYERN